MRDSAANRTFFRYGQGKIHQQSAPSSCRGVQPVSWNPARARDGILRRWLRVGESRCMAKRPRLLTEGAGLTGGGGGVVLFGGAVVFPLVCGPDLPDALCASASDATASAATTAHTLHTERFRSFILCVTSSRLPNQQRTTPHADRRVFRQASAHRRRGLSSTN